MHKDSERREQWQIKKRQSFLDLALPSRIIAYQKIVKGESNDK